MTKPPLTGPQNTQFSRCLLPLCQTIFMPNHSRNNVFHLFFHHHIQQTHFHVKKVQATTCFEKEAIKNHSRVNRVTSGYPKRQPARNSGSKFYNSHSWQRCISSRLANNWKTIYLIRGVFPFLGDITFQLDVESSRNQQLTCCRDEYREPIPS